MRTITAYDAYLITGRGIVVSVDVEQTNGMGRGDRVQFRIRENQLIHEGLTYEVTGVEESRCLVDHGGAGQCVTGRGLVVKRVDA